MTFLYSHPVTAALVLVGLAYGIAGVAIWKRPAGAPAGTTNRNERSAA